MQTRPFFLTTTTVDIDFSHVLSSFLQRGVFLDHLLVTIAGEVYRQFGVLVFALAFDDQTYAVFRVTYARPDLQSRRACRAALVVRAGARLEIGGVDISALPGEELLNAVGAVVSPALIIARSPRRPRRRGRRFAALEGRSIACEAQPASALRLIFDQFQGELHQEARGIGRRFGAVHPTFHGVRQVKIFLGARDGHITEPPIFLQVVLALVRDSMQVWELL